MTQYEWHEDNYNHANSYLFSSRLYMIKLSISGPRRGMYIAKYYNSNGSPTPGGVRLFPDLTIYGARGVEDAKQQSIDYVVKFMLSELQDLTPHLANRSRASVTFAGLLDVLDK